MTNDETKVRDVVDRWRVATMANELDIRIESKHDIHEIYASGDLAYCRSHISVVATSVKTGERRKSADGKWR